MNIKAVSEATGVSMRALRHYEALGLLMPQRHAENDYRQYTQEDIDRLRQILIYKQLDFSLKDIQQLLTRPSSDIFEQQLRLLKTQITHLQLTIQQLEKYIEGEGMTVKEQFSGLEEMIESNERQFGEEMRSKYGKRTVDETYDYLKHNRASIDKTQHLSDTINDLLAKLVKEQVPLEDEQASNLFKLHKEWLHQLYPNYSNGYHLSMAMLYESDARFTDYYEEVVAGGCAYLVAVIRKNISE